MLTLSTATDDSETNSGDSVDDLVDLFRGLQKDIKDHKEETAQLKAETVRLNRALVLEQEERKEVLKAALKAERAKREEMLKAERAKWEEVLKAERVEWEEALKVEREECECECACAEQQSKKAEADKKYELLKNHLKLRKFLETQLSVCRTND